MESHPELLTAISDKTVLAPYSELIEELLSAVFPPTTQYNIHAVSFPFKFQTVYTSPLFKTMLLKPNSDMINVPDTKIGATLSQEKLQFAYGLIIKKYLGYNSPSNIRSIHPFTDPISGLTKYMELRIDARFIDVRPVDEMPPLPESIICPRTNRIMTIAELMEQVPLEKFAFEGISVVRVNDVTEQEVISLIKNKLLHINTLPDNSGYSELESYIQSLIGIKDVKIGGGPATKYGCRYTCVSRKQTDRPGNYPCYYAACCGKRTDPSHSIRPGAYFTPLAHLTRSLYLPGTQSPLCRMWYQAGL